MQIKACLKCRGLFALSAFYVVRGRPMARCKDCVKAAVRRHRQECPSVQEYDRARAKKSHVKARIIANAQRWREAHPDRYRAHTALNNAIRDGKLAKGACEVCGVARVHAHHEDYSKPLVVRWLCPRHHAAELRVADPLRFKIRAA